MLLGAEGSYLDVVASARGLFIDDSVPSNKRWLACVLKRIGFDKARCHT